MPRLVDGLEQIFTDLGIVGDGYKLFFFAHNTTTPKNTYSNPELTIANPNPVVCDASGRPEMDVWGADSSTYKMVLGTPDSILGNIDVVRTIDPINVLNSGIISITPLPTAYWGATTGTSSQYILNPALVPITSYSNVQCFFIDFNIANSSNATININGLGEVTLKKYTGTGAKVNLIAGDLQVQRYLLINDGVDIVVLNPEHPANLIANTTTWRGLTYLSSPIIISNNVSTPNTAIDFSGGIFQFSDGSGQGIGNAWTKTTAAWSIGNNGGGLDTGSIAINTWYHSYAIANITNPGTPITDYLFSINPSSPTLPAGYTKYKRLRAGQILTDGSSNIIPFLSNGIQTNWVTVRQDLNINQVPTTALLVTMSTPFGIRTYPIAQYLYYENTTPVGAGYGLVTGPDQTDSTPSASLFQWLIGPGNSQTQYSGLVQTNISSQIRLRKSGVSSVSFFVVLTSGWIDNNI